MTVHHNANRVQPTTQSAILDHPWSQAISFPAKKRQDALVEYWRSVFFFTTDEPAAERDEERLDDSSSTRSRRKL